MSNSNPDLQQIAVRVYPDGPKPGERSKGSSKSWRRPEAVLVFDTETLTDETQALTFGSYRFLVSGRCMEEGLFCADDLSPKERQVLQAYTETHKPETVAEGCRTLRLLSLKEFLERFYTAAYKGRCLVVGFNLPFDLSRVACDASAARGRFAGGFSLSVWTYGEQGSERINGFRPRVGIKQIDSKRALKGFTARNSPDRVDLIPEGSTSGKPKPGYVFRGHFLDLRTLAFALTDRGYSLETACKAFGVEHGKQQATRHGEIDEGYIDYNRRDVLATWELAEKLFEEYEQHPIALQPTKAYSPASIGKAYLREMGVTPILERQPDFPKAYLGYAQSAFFGGRSSAHIRKVSVPVVYTDFLSMYPTVNSLMNLWRFVVAGKIRVVEHCEDEIREFLSNVTVEKMFNPATWTNLAAFVQVIPEGDILPSRSKYSVESNDWQVSVNRISAGEDSSSHALWFSLPDVVASVLLTRRVPKIVSAFRLEALGTLPGLKPVKLRSKIQIDPRQHDFFRVVIEERNRLSSRTDLSDEEEQRLNKALKVLANSASYGIYAEMNRQESDDAVDVTCHGIDPECFTCRVAHPDVAGEYCFPPLASLITGGARLMLALLERCVTDLSGTYAMEDTDSMAIVATQRGGLVPCPGGRNHMPDGIPAVCALSWKQVHQIARRFESLNPYSRDAVPGSILKIEDDNRDPKTGRQREISCFAISVKRYALFEKDSEGCPVLLREGVNNKTNRWSEHGLGHLLNPTNPHSEDREWIGQVWQALISKALRFPTSALPFENLPAVGRVTVSSPAVMRAFASFTAGRKYAAQIKPFNFVLTCHVMPFGHPSGTNPERFHLIAPYQTDSRRWLKTRWIDQYTGKQYTVTTAATHGGRHSARVKTYGDVLREYEFHPESKCADADGNARDKQTIGLLQRRHIRIERVRYIGKESNSLEDVDSGLIHSAESVYTEYTDPRRDEWETTIRPVLKATPLSRLIALTGLSRRALIDYRTGRSRPHASNKQRLISVVSQA